MMDQEGRYKQGDQDSDQEGQDKQGNQGDQKDLSFGDFCLFED